MGWGLDLHARMLLGGRDHYYCQGRGVFFLFCFVLFCLFKKEKGDWGNAETEDLFC